MIILAAVRYEVFSLSVLPFYPLRGESSFSSINEFHPCFPLFCKGHIFVAVWADPLYISFQTVFPSRLRIFPPSFTTLLCFHTFQQSFYTHSSYISFCFQLLSSVYFFHSNILSLNFFIFLPSLRFTLYILRTRWFLLTKTCPGSLSVPVYLTPTHTLVKHRLSTLFRLFVFSFLSAFCPT